MKLFMMLSKNALLQIVLATVILFLMIDATKEVDNCSNKSGICTAFKSYELPATTKAISQRGELSLISAGMRRKFFLDIYVVGLYMSEKSASTKSAVIKKSDDFVKLADENLQLLLRFMRTVSTNQVVGGIVDALSGGSDAYLKSLDQFKSALLSAIGPEGFNVKSELIFSYKGKDTMDIGINGELVGSVTNAVELKKRLLSIYVGSKAVAPEVVDVLTKRYLTESTPKK